MAEKRSIWSAAVSQTCWRAKVLTTYLKCGGIVKWLCSASIKSSCASKRRKLSQPRCIEEIYRPKYQYPIERWILPCEYVPPTSEFMANRIFVRSNTFDSSNGNARVKNANEASWDRSDEMKSGYFRVSARSECVSTYILWPNYMPKTDGRATVIGNENVYTNSDFRGGIERHQTNWTYLLPGSEWLYLDEPSLNLASKILMSPARNAFE